MQIKYVYTGSWFPRTKLHLREFFNFLSYQFTENHQEKARLISLGGGLQFTDVKYHGGIFDMVTARNHDLELEYEEDGLLLLKKNGESWPDDHSFLDDFYQNKLTPFLFALFSRGAPSLEMVRIGIRVRPTILVANRGTADEIDEVFGSIGDSSHSTVSQKGVSVYFGDKIILIIAKNPEAPLVKYLVRFYCFFREYEAYLYRFMKVDRRIWDRINEIRGHQTIASKDLPGLRDQLILFKRDVNVIKLRLSQMDNYLDERQRDIELKKLAKTLEFFKAYRFEKMASIHEYIFELVSTTEKYVEDAVGLLELMYQENQQKEISSLQVIFLVGTIANLLMLGGVTTFKVSGLIFWGGSSILVSVLIYLGWQYIFKRIRVYKAISMLERPNQENDI